MGPWINNDIQKITGGLGEDPSVGPKLDMWMLFAGLTLDIAVALICYIVPIPELHHALDKGSGLRSLLLTGGVSVAYCYILQQEYRPRIDQFGLRRKIIGSRRALGWTAIGVAFAAANFGGFYVLGRLILPRLAGQSVAGVHLMAPVGFTDTADFFILVLVVPLIEELIFRGYLYLVLRQNYGRRWGAILTSVAFAIAHLPNVVGVFVTFFFSLAWIYLDNKGGSLAPSIAAHASQNAITNLLKYTFR